MFVNSEDTDEMVQLSAILSGFHWFVTVCQDRCEKSSIKCTCFRKWYKNLIHKKYL